MTAAAFDALKESLREALTRAYLHGALQMSNEGSVPLSYPESDAETARVLAALDERPDSVEWAVFWGGEDPADCAGWDSREDEADAEEHVQWITGGGIASRPVFCGPWTVTRPARPEPAPGEDPADLLTEADRAEYRQWRAERGLRA